MCGNVGCAGNISDKHYKAFRDMLLFDVIRGQDSTGVIKVGLNYNSKPEIAKDLGHPLALWDEYALNNMFNSRGIINGYAKTLIGHNRSATFGEVNTENAHPFSYEHIHGVHNGTLFHTHLLDGNFDVDSKEIFYTLSRKGIEDTWPLINGAAALVWWDESDHTLNLIRNSSRPLFFLYNEKRDVLFWASEAWMIKVSMSRNGIAPAKNKDGVKLSPVPLTEETWYQFKPSASGIKLMTSKKLEPYKPPYNNYYTGFKTVKTVNTYSKHAWAKGLKKADKEIRGQLVKLNFCMSLWSEKLKGFEKYLVGELVETGKRIEIHPVDAASHDKWEKQMRECDGNLIVRMTSRPRVKFAIKDDPTVFSISCAHITLVSTVKKKSIVAAVEQRKEAKSNITTFLVKGYGGINVTEETFNASLKKAGSTCLSCDVVLTKDDAQDIHWLNEDSILCEPCSSDPYIQNLTRGL